MVVNARWRAGFLCAVFMLLAACAVGTGVPAPRKIALLAPFEGRYREVGYEALYAARLALSDAGSEHLALLAVDDGGSTESAALRAQALADDPQVYAVLLLGYAAASDDVLDAFDDLPVLIAGNWGGVPNDAAVFVLASAETSGLLTVPPHPSLTSVAASTDTVIGAEALTLKEFALLRGDLSQVTVVSSGRLPDAQLHDKIVATNAFANEPGLLSTLAYDAANVLIMASRQAGDRTDVREYIATQTFAGVNGLISFADGYWKDAPIHYYQYNANRDLYIVP